MIHAFAWVLVIIAVLILGAWVVIKSIQMGS